MGDRTKIGWTEATWNPVTGCDKVSPGCDHCYAETTAHRFAGTPAYPDGFKVTLRPERLDQPLRWKKPRMIFVNSMSDLFHKDIPDEYIARIFAIMALAPHHTFQVLTKRHGRMRSLLNDAGFKASVWSAIGDLPVGVSGYTQDIIAMPWPLPNVWLGVTVEDQQRADLRIPALLDTPAAVRFLSCEPLLGPIDLAAALAKYRPGDEQPWSGDTLRAREVLHWVIVGGESGHGARPMHPDWARSLRDQCQAADIAFFFKQWGEWAAAEQSGEHNTKMSKHRMQYDSIRFRPNGITYSATADALDAEVGYSAPGMASVLRVGTKKSGHVLDGRTWEQFPEVPQ